MPRPSTWAHVSVTTPSALAGWLAALERYGSMSIENLFAPAIEYAESGVPLTVKNAMFYESASERLHGAARDTFYASGPPQAGAIIRQPELAETYRTISKFGAEALYDGDIGKRMIAAVQAAGGVLTEQDLANVAVRWADPSISSYRGYELRTTSWPMTSYEMQLTLNVLEGFDLYESGHNSARDDPHHRRGHEAFGGGSYCLRRCSAATTRGVALQIVCKAAARIDRFSGGTPG